ncbi:MAG: hypothetical protein QM662_12865 [Gordonia sp. (in: high G+C Gram-positive bacteria)]
MTVPDLKSRNVVSLAANLLHLYPHLHETLALSAYAHDGQERKEVRAGVAYRDPYVIHPIRCALRLHRWTEGLVDLPTRTRIVAAALLHDVIEDVPARAVEFAGLPPGYTADEAIAVVASPTIAGLVRGLTFPSLGDHTDRDAAYARRLRETIARVGRPFDDDAFVLCLVKSSDLVDNAGSLKWMPDEHRQRRLARKYRVPVGTLIEALTERRPAEELGLAEARAANRAAGRLARVADDLAEILDARAAESTA